MDEYEDIPRNGSRDFKLLELNGEILVCKTEVSDLWMMNVSGQDKKE